MIAELAALKRVKWAKAICALAGCEAYHLTENTKNYMNKSILVGRLGKDHELCYSISGSRVANIRIEMMDESYADRDGRDSYIVIEGGKNMLW